MWAPTGYKIELKSAATICMLSAMPIVSSANPQNAPPFTSFVERCIVPASNYHQVNQDVLRAILKVESGLKPTAVGRNSNGTTDVGIGQMNSMHFHELGKYGIAPEHLKDACVGTYVAAWQLKKGIFKYGNTWFGIATYHSATPYFNNRYQILLRNELVKAPEEIEAAFKEWSATTVESGVAVKYSGAESQILYIQFQPATTGSAYLYKSSAVDEHWKVWAKTKSGRIFVVIFWINDDLRFVPDGPVKESIETLLLNLIYDKRGDLVEKLNLPTKPA